MKFLCYLATIMILTTTAALAATGSIEFVNRWPETSPNVMAGDGTYLYHGDGEVISVYDPTDFTLQDRVTISLTGAGDIGEGEVAGTEGISGVFYADGYLYVTCGSEGLRIYETTTPQEGFLNPVSSADYPVIKDGKRAFAKDIYVDGNYAYLAYFWLTSEGYDSGLEIIDVSDPTAPEWVSTGKLPSSFAEIKKAQAIVVSEDGKYAYIADMFNGMGVFDISDKTDPQLTAYSYMASALDVAVSDDGYAYVACAGNGINVVDVGSDKITENIDNLDITAFSDYAVEGTKSAAVEASGDHIYVGDVNLGLVILDNSDPEGISDSSWIGHYSENLAGVYRVYVDEAEDMAYAGDTRNGLVQIDVSDPAEPALVSDAEDTATPADIDALHIDIATSYVYGVDDDATTTEGIQEGLRVLFAVKSDNYVTFLLKGWLGTEGEARDVVADGDYVYIADGSDGLKIIDPGLPEEDADGNRATENPVSPVLIGGYDESDGFSGDATGVCVANDNAYVAARAGGLQIFDVSDPTIPTLEGKNETDVTDARAVFVENNLAYVADGTEGLKIVDVSEKNDPVLRGVFEIPDGDDQDEEPGTAMDVIKVGNLAYIAALNEGLQVLDVSDPDDPFYFGDRYTAVPYNEVKGVYAARSDVNDSVDLVWLANGQGGTEGGETMGFFTNPDTVPPQRVNGYRSFGDAKDVMAIGDFAYLADSAGGLQVLGVREGSGELGDWHDDVTSVNTDRDISSGCFIEAVFSRLSAWRPFGN
ncbi:MAG: LVIVD repeat-containing protein [Desulfosudaceae bacterium]